MNAKEIHEYARVNGAYTVWKTWRDTMLAQGREVKPEYMAWPIPERDIDLDFTIASEVIVDFLAWVETGHGAEDRHLSTKEQKAFCF